MQLIERYVYAVTRQLPPAQRTEVSKELASLIHDMLSSNVGDGEPSPEDVQQVLEQLGDPTVIAENYRGEKRYLIGPRYFPTYFSLLRIVVAAVTLGLTVALAVEFVVNPPSHVLTAALRFVTTIVGGATQVFAGMTIIFALLEYFCVDMPELKEEKWRPSDLPPVPAQTTRISTAEPIVAIVFSIITLIILNTALSLIGVYFTDPGSGWTIVPMLNPDALAPYLPYFNIILVMGIALESVKIMIGRWTVPVSVVNMLYNIAAIAIFVIAVSDLSIWNSAFLNFILDTGVVTSRAALEQGLITFTRGLIGIVTFALVLDMVIPLVKAVRYKTA